ncbi:MAG: o-succinylbenzoate synthase [Candidatus Latescibacteria bacterium]|nr:o-succinylbenzoate synthase [Candidatus Latescibacterota bacterium]
MLKVHSITLREISLPLKEPFKISSGVTTDRRILLLELSDGEGTSAWSECVAAEWPNYFYETVDTAWLVICRYVAPRVIGRALQSPSEIRQLLDKDFRGHNMAKAAVEMGVWELEARRRDIPLSRLLGGVRERIEVGISIGIQPSPEALVEKAEAYLKEGYRKIKMKVMPGADLAYASAARRALGSGAPLMVDANNAYTLDDIETLLALDDLGLLMIEQPLAWDDVVQHAVLQEKLKTPICLDESITGPERVRDMIALGSGRIVNIKPGRVGGFATSIAIHDLCEQEGIPVWCGGMLESGIGRGYNVALASLPNFHFPGDISPSARYWNRDVVTPEWTMDPDGTMALRLDKPGTGVDVDRELIDDLTVRVEVLTAETFAKEAPE